GAISARDLEHGLQVQLRRKLNRFFYLEDGRFEFEPKEHVVQAVSPLNPVPVIFHGIRSAYDEDRLSRVLLPLTGLELRLPASFDASDEGLGFNGEEQELLRHLSEFRPIAELTDGK